MPDQRLAIKTPIVTHERLDDEVIAINLETGIYYALVGPAADIWSMFDPEGTIRGAVHLLARRYGLEPDAIHADVDAFARRLQDAGLLTPGPADRLEQPAAMPPLPPASRWTAPELEEYRDMADLVLIDPIHQVDETGWPRLPDQQA